VARAAIVLHMDDRPPLGAGTGQQSGDALHDFFSAMERLGNSEHALLDIDDHQRARHRPTLGENATGAKRNCGTRVDST
jgi:hypothetical protein